MYTITTTVHFAGTFHEIEATRYTTVIILYYQIVLKHHTMYVETLGKYPKWLPGSAIDDDEGGGRRKRVSTYNSVIEKCFGKKMEQNGCGTELNGRNSGSTVCVERSLSPHPVA